MWCPGGRPLALLLVILIQVVVPGGATADAATAGPAPRLPPAFEDLGTLGGGYSEARAINDAGMIVGSSTTSSSSPSRAFVAGPGSGPMVDLGTTAEFSTASGIAEDGTIVGQSGPAQGCQPIPCPPTAFWRSGDPPTFGPVPPSAPFKGNDASDANDAGLVVGEMDLSDFPVVYAPHGYVYDRQTHVLTDVGVLAEGVSSTAEAVNEAGVVVGTSQINYTGLCVPYACGDAHGFVRPAGGPGLVDVGTLGGTNSAAHAINESGWVAGESQLAGDAAVHAFVRDPVTGALTDLGTLGGTNSHAYGINDDGWVVGSSDIADDAASHAFAYDPVEDLMIDLGSLGSTGSVAYDINNCREVVGASGTEAGEPHAVRLVFPRFADVPGSHPFFHDVCWLERSGATTGFSDGTFRPGLVASRQALVAWLYRLAGAPPGPFDDPGFPDVPGDHPFRTEIAWAAEQGLVEGYPDGTFRPAAAVSRQASVAWLHRQAGSPAGPYPEPSFSDVDPSDPFAHEIAWAEAEGIVEGYADGTFRPTRAVARQAAAAILHRATPD